jgi:hypothetical protein
MAAKLTRLTHKIAIQLHLVAENCTICVSLSKLPVRKRLDAPSYIYGVNPERRKMNELFDVVDNSDVPGLSTFL